RSFREDIMGRVSRRTILGGIGAAAVASQFPKPLRAQETKKVTLSTALRLANYIPAYAAKREGIFEKHGLDVDITAAGTIAEPMSILNAGRAEFAMTGTGMAVNSSLAGAETKVFARMAG